MADAAAVVCDLVLLSWNHLEETQPCLESLFATTTVPSRLFIVDNGSAPPVRAFLQAVRPQGSIREVVLLQNDTNEGFPRGMNRGIRAATAPYVCLLNNDLRFTAGWLEELLHVAAQDPAIGVVNPGSSTFGQHPAPGQSLEAFAAACLRQRHGEYTEVGMCIGFCMLMTRAALDHLGGLSEEVERIFFEDEDFCMRANAAEFRCVVAEGAYVYHAEHKTVKKMPERETLFSRNQAWCEKRWGRWVRVLWPQVAGPEAGSAAWRAWLEQLRRVARQRTHVYVYVPAAAWGGPQAFFRQAGLVPHADVHWHAGPRALTPWLALWRLLTRRKKPFDVVVAPPGIWGRLIRGLQGWHRAVIVEPNEEAIRAACQAQSRLRLSS